MAFAIVAVVDGDGATFGRGLEAGLAATAGLGLLHLAYPAGLGFGDVKLAFVLGVATGWASWGALGLAIFLAAALGATVGVIGALAAGEPVRGRRLPFGPFLAAGALLAAVIGPSFRLVLPTPSLSSRKSAIGWRHCGSRRPVAVPNDGWST